MKTKLFLLTLFTIFINANAQIGFQDYLISHHLQDPYIVLSADLDGDGDMDIITGENNAGHDGIFWYENEDGLGNFIPHQSIESHIGSVTSLFLADIDNDGDIDVLSSSWRDGKVSWYENMDGKGNFSEKQFITGTGGGGVTAGDIDGDGDMDVVTAKTNIQWYENTDGLGNFTSRQYKSAGGTGALSVIVHDMDNDGDNDIVYSTIGSSASNKIAWLENTNGLGNFSIEHSVASGTTEIISLQIADVDGDGNTDVISAFPLDDKIVWYKNTDGLGTFSSENVISTEFKKPRSVFASDIDNDGDIDLFSASYDETSRYEFQKEYLIVWFENTDGLGSFSHHTILSSKPKADSVYAMDIDNDGDIDLVATGDYNESLHWFENTNNMGDFSSKKTINNNSDDILVYPVDIDNDGDQDLVSAEGNNKLIWYENKDSKGDFGIQKLISLEVSGPTSVHSTDIDGDGDFDVLSSSEFDDKIAWYENIDGLGSFSIQKIITTNADNTNFVNSGDLDNDGDQDVIVASWNKLTWFKNTNGLGNFDSEQIIISDDSGFTLVYPVDLDNDNDLDIISTSKYTNKISWYENTNGLGVFSSEKIITTTNNRIFSIFATDIDGDGDLDIGSITDSEISWYENTNGLGLFSSKNVIDNSNNSLRDALSTDMDNDGDMDIVFTTNPSLSFGKIAWIENIDGLGNFGSAQIIEEQSTIRINVADFDNDGDNDVISASGQELSWHKNLGIVRNEINGTARLDFNSNGCDDLDLLMPSLIISTSNGTDNLATLTNQSGIYQVFTEIGGYATSIATQLPNYFTITPAAPYNNSFEDIGNTDSNNDFCIESTQTINDINISIYPENQARPGFDSSYRIVFNNIGTTKLNGDITLEFDNTKLVFLTATESVSQTINTLTFSYSNLNPFETRSISLNFNVFAPPTTNIDDILTFTATINPISGDNSESDNVFELNQTVIGSYDPNDIFVLEGSQILIEDADKYLHYIIRFQNTGTASAINVKIDNILDANLDWTTLQLESSSHTNRVEIKDGNEVSFIFNGIYLPDSTSDEPNSHGFIAYKIKPKRDVIVGDIMPNQADIFFDFNPAIVTNMVTTEITSSLSADENFISKFYLYPNPTKNVLNIQSKTHITKLEVYNNVGQIVFSESNKTVVDISTLGTGIYFIKIKDEIGNSETKKVIKE